MAGFAPVQRSKQALAPSSGYRPWRTDSGVQAGMTVMKPSCDCPRPRGLLLVRYRRMAETAAHRVDHVFPEAPVRQWVLSLPKRLRDFLHHDARLVNPVLRIFLAEVEAALRSCSPDAPSGARFGAVVHRFGSALNANLHFDAIHPCISPFGSLRGPNLLPADWSLLRHRRRVQRGRGGSPVSPGLPDRGRHCPRSAADPAPGVEAVRAPRTVAGGRVATKATVCDWGRRS